MTQVRVVALLIIGFGMLGAAWGFTLFGSARTPEVWSALQQDSGPFSSYISPDTMATMGLLLVALPCLVVAGVGCLIWAWAGQRQEYEDERWLHFRNEAPEVRRTKHKSCLSRGRFFKMAARALAAFAIFSLFYLSFGAILLSQGFTTFEVHLSSNTELLLALFFILSANSFIPFGLALGFWRLSTIELKRAEKIFALAPSNEPK